LEQAKQSGALAANAPALASFYQMQLIGKALPGCSLNQHYLILCYNKRWQYYRQKSCTEGVVANTTDGVSFRMERCNRATIQYWKFPALYQSR
jgi:hypothetical protein